MCLVAAAPLAAGAAAAGAGTAAATGFSAMEMLSMAGMAMQGLSTIANQSAAKSQANARNNVALQEQQRQREMQAQADTVNSETQSKFTREAQDQQMQREVDARNAVLTSSVAMPTNLRAIPTNPDAPATINSQIADSISKALGYGKTLAGASAKLGAYSGNQFNNGITLNRSATDVSRIATDSGRSSDIAGMELESANRAGQGARNIGDLFRVAGSGLSTYGMLGKPSAPTEVLGNGLQLGGGTGLKIGAGIGLR